MARGILPSDCTWRDKFIRSVSILRDIARTQALSRRNFKFADAFTGNQAEKIFYVGFDNVLDIIRALHGIFKRVEFHLRGIFRPLRAGVQLFFCSEFRRVDIGTDFVFKAERFNDERRIIALDVFCSDDERHFSFERGKNSGGNLSTKFRAVHGDRIGGATVRNGNFIA